MKKKAYLKNQVRIIKKTKARFLSIFCIVFLGASFFAGLRQSPVIMKESIHDYLQTYQWNDLNYIATYGFNDSVIKKVQKLKEVENVDYGFRFDALMSYDEKANIGMTVYSDDDFKFNYDTNFRVNKKDNKYSIINKDDSAKITIEVVENSTGVEDKNRALEIADGKVNDNYQRTSFNCLDHICMSVFESDKKHVVVDVEFIEK